MWSMKKLVMFGALAALVAVAGCTVRALWLRPRRAALGGDVDEPEPVARACVALFSDWLPATTGELLHVDGGYHAVGA